MLPLRGKSMFNILSDMDVSQGFCSVICFIKQEVVPIAYGVNGDGEYDWKKILNATLPPSFSKNTTNTDNQNPQTALANTPQIPVVNLEKEITSTQTNAYNDEEMAMENYYSEVENAHGNLPETVHDAKLENQTQTQEQNPQFDLEKDANAQSVRQAFTTQSQGYYLAIKEEIRQLFKKYPRDTTLERAFSYSEWVRVKGEANKPTYLVGVVYDDGNAKYICYALAAEDKNQPPQEIANVCTFVPLSSFQDSQGFFVIFQSAATGECIKPQRL